MAREDEAPMNARKSVEPLDRDVAAELQAAHQRRYRHFHLDDSGFGPMAMTFERIAIAAMSRVERMADRIAFLQGDVKMEAAAPVAPIAEAQNVLARAAAVEPDGAAACY